MGWGCYLAPLMRVGVALIIINVGVAVALDCFPMDSTSTADDLTTLPFIDQNVLLHQLRQRFLQGMIYVRLRVCVAGESER